MTQTTSISEFADEIRTERRHQAKRWGNGTPESLDRIDREKNSPESFTAFIAHHASRWFPGGFPPHSVETLETFRAQMIKVATLAFAAVRWADAKIAEKKRCLPENI